MDTFNPTPYVKTIAFQDQNGILVHQQANVLMKYNEEPGTLDYFERLEFKTPFNYFLQEIFN